MSHRDLLDELFAAMRRDLDSEPFAHADTPIPARGPFPRGAGGQPITVSGPGGGRALGMPSPADEDDPAARHRRTVTDAVETTEPVQL